MRTTKYQLVAAGRMRQPSSDATNSVLTDQNVSFHFQFTKVNAHEISNKSHRRAVWP